MSPGMVHDFMTFPLWGSETVRNPGFMTSEPENLPEHPEMFIPRTSSVTRLDALQPRDMVVDVVLQV